MKSKVLITQKILPEALDYLNEHTEYEIGAAERILTKKELMAKIKDKEGLLSLLVNTVDKDVIDAAFSENHRQLRRGLRQH